MRTAGPSAAPPAGSPAAALAGAAEPTAAATIAIAANLIGHGRGLRLLIGDVPSCSACLTMRFAVCR